ncbi:alpha/beta-hydrolase [Xylariomycetidae sp. FL2044]|nr:alpha/beta-hydrolase [Xylariomycetidae sp. FL2044]
MAPVVARLISESKPYLVPGKIQVKEYWFEVPLDHSQPDTSPRLKLFARSATRYEKPIVEEKEPSAASSQKPFMLYLQGGPGHGCPMPQDSTLSKYMLDRGYALLFLDQRGTGFSSPVSAETLARAAGSDDPGAQAAYLRHFRADTLVRDSEAVRRCLTAAYDDEERRRWSTFGQSFGGMMTSTYLSLAPEGLRECFVTGGLGALDRGPEDVYRATYPKVLARNRAYYAKFPQDVAVVKELAGRIFRETTTTGGEKKKGLPLPAGGRLTVPRFLALGLHLGMDGGIDKVHNLVLRMKGDLDQYGVFTRGTLSELEQDGWDVAPIYSLLHEPCWCYGPGVAGRWAAQRVGQGMDEFAWLRDDWAGPAAALADDADDDEPLYFSGEMVYPFFFDTCAGLAALKGVAQELAEFDGWAPLYDLEQLARNEVPVYAAIYDDMYVDAAESRVTASRIRGAKVFETNMLYHSALRTKPDEVIPQLLKLRDDTID